MNKHRSLVATLGFAWLIFCSPCLAANPLVVFPQGDFSCTVDVTPRDIPKPDPAHPERRYAPVLQKIAITQVGKVRRDISTWSDGSTSQVWSLAEKGVSLFESNAKGKDVYLLRGERRHNVCPRLLRFDAESVSWISEKTLDKQPTGDGKFLHYQSKVVIAEANGPIPAETATYQAWIDPKTLLPLRLDDGAALYSLTFSSDSPAEPLVMPANIQAELDRWLKASVPRPRF